MANIGLVGMSGDGPCGEEGIGDGDGLGRFCFLVDGECGKGLCSGCLLLLFLFSLECSFEKVQW